MSQQWLAQDSCSERSPKPQALDDCGGGGAVSRTLAPLAWDTAAVGRASRSAISSRRAGRAPAWIAMRLPTRSRRRSDAPARCVVINLNRHRTLDPHRVGLGGSGLVAGQQRMSQQWLAQDSCSERSPKPQALDDCGGGGAVSRTLAPLAWDTAAVGRASRSAISSRRAGRAPAWIAMRLPTRSRRRSR